MKRLIIIFLSIISLFIISCNYQILNPNNSNSSNNSNEGNNNGSNEDNSSNGSGSDSGEDNDNSENITKTMYFKFKVSGKSSQEAFNKNDIFPRELSIKNYANDKTFSHTGNWGDPGYIVNYLFCDDKIGNSMSMPFYAGDSKLEILYKEKDTEITFKGYIWIGNSGTLFVRNDFSCAIPINDYDEYKARETINDYYFSGIPYKINMYGNIPEISWQPNSLKQAIDMTFGFMLCSEKNPLKICKHCGKVFYAKNPKAEYDSSQCRNQANVYKSRNKNKAD